MSRGFASTYRIVVLACLVFAAFAGLAARLVVLHVIDRAALLATVEKTRREMLPEFARRGNIVDQHGLLLATSRSLIVLGADPLALRPGDEKKWPDLARLLDRPLPEISRLLTTKYRPAATVAVASGARTSLVFNLTPPDDGDTIEGSPEQDGRRPIRWVKLSDDVAETTYKQIAALDLAGVYPARTFRRAYPHKQLAAHLLGYVNHEQAPMAGLEHYLQFYLRGENGWIESEKDGSAHPRELAQFRSREVHAADGYDVQLSIDAAIQSICEDELKTLAEKWHPKQATIIVSDPRTGFLLALANYPSYDPNTYNQLTKDQQSWMNNVAVDAEYEPGSVFKIVAIAGALEQRLVTPATTFDCSIKKTTVEYRGKTLKIPKEDISDHFDHPLSISEIIEHSSNKGTVQAAMVLGQEKFYDYVKAFGFGQRTGFPIGGEIAGSIRTPGNPHWTLTDFTRHPMGQALAVTPLQMHYAMSVIAAQGVLYRPQIIREIHATTGGEGFVYGPQEVRRVISQETAHTMARLLWGVANIPPVGNTPGGTAQEAKIAGFDVGGKTGTANKPDGHGGYMDRHHVVSSFIGFFPVDNPQVDISVIVDDADASHYPHGTAYGHLVAAPAFHDIAMKLIPYLPVQSTEASYASQSALALNGGRR